MARDIRKQPGQEGKDEIDDPARDLDFDKLWEATNEADAKKAREWKEKWLKWANRGDKRAPYTPWLVVPCNFGDFGARPLPPGTAHYQSPFIGVVSPDPSGVPLAGSPNTVFATVFNFGAATSAPTQVSFYWCDPSVGLGAADANLIGSTMVEVPPGQGARVDCPVPWVPLYVNGGHECLFVTASNPVFDPMTAPFKPWADRHVGQRNITVMPAFETKLIMWIPAGRRGALGELRVLALLAQAPAGFDLQATPFDTLAWAAAQVHHPMLPPRRGERAEEAPRIVIRQIAAEKVIAGIGFTGETRAQKTLEDRPALDAEGKQDAAFGEVMLKLEPELGVLRQISVDVRALDLRPDEIVVVTFTYLSGGLLEGGYGMVLASPDWFDSPGLQRFSARIGTGGMMEHEQKADPGGRGIDDYALMELVIDHNPEARAVHELARQLAPMLPIKSLDALAENMKSLKLAGLSVPVALFADQIAPEAFPIDDPRDLVWKLSGAVHIGMTEGQARQSVLNGETALLLARMQETVPGRRAPTPSGYFTGPSMFGTAPKREV